MLGKANAVDDFQQQHNNNNNQSSFGDSRYVAGNQFYNHEMYGSMRAGGAVKFYSKECIGLVAAVFSSAFSFQSLQGVLRPLMSSKLNLTKQENIAVQRLIVLPMALSFFVGLLSDCYPIMGLHCKAYMTVGMLTNAACVLAMAGITAHFESQTTTERDSRLVTLVIVMSAFASVGCIITYMCVHTRVIELSQREALHDCGSIQVSYLVFRCMTSLVTASFSYLTLGSGAAGGGHRAQHGALERDTTARGRVRAAAAGHLALLEGGAVLTARVHEDPRLDLLEDHAVARRVGHPRVHLVLRALPRGQFSDSANVVRGWAKGAANDNSLLLKTIQDVIMLFTILAWRFFMNCSCRTFFWQTCTYKMQVVFVLKTSLDSCPHFYTVDGLSVCCILAAMDILEDLHDHDDVKFDPHVLLDSATAVGALGASSAITVAGAEDDEDGGVALPDGDDDEHEDASLHQMTLRGERSGSSSKRRKIGKALQLVLLRKYVQCAKQLDHLPSRAMTEQLLEEGYDEFYFHGGSLREPRLGYTTFLKLVRNRRGEVIRQTRDLRTLSHGRSSRRHQKERLEIGMLIEELERVRQGHLRSPIDYDVLDESDTAGSSSCGTVSMLSSTDHSVADSTSHHHHHHHHGVSSVAAPAAIDTAGELHVGEDVLISREKLDMMLRFAQETLKAQKKILDEVRAIERRLELNQL